MTACYAKTAISMVKTLSFHSRCMDDRFMNDTYVQQQKSNWYFEIDYSEDYFGVYFIHESATGLAAGMGQNYA